MTTKLVPNIILRGANNYNMWRHNLHATLQSKKLWQFIEGTRTSRPTTAPAVTHDPQPLDPAEATAYDTKVATLQAAALEAAQERWDLQAQQTLGLIALSLHSSIQSLVTAATKPTNAWTTLEMHYNPAKTAVRFNLYAELTELKLKLGTELTTHFTHVDKLITRLKTKTSEITEDQVNFFTLNSLPSSFEVIKTVILSSQVPITKDSVHQALLQHKAHFPKLTHRSAPQHDTLLYAPQHHQPAARQGGPFPPHHHRCNNQRNGRGNQCNQASHQPHQTPFNPDTSCSYCLRVGHSVNNCWTHSHDRQDKGNPMRGHDTRPRPHNHLNTTILISETTSHSMRSNLRGWIFNTSATGSFSFQQELFHNYTPVTPGDQSVKLGDHHMLAIKGCGTIHTFTYVEGRQVNIVLHDVAHVPSLHTNILSPNALLSNSFIITLMDGGCEVHHRLALHPLFHIEQVDGLLIVPLMARPTPGHAAINHAAHTATPPCTDCANQSTLSNTDHRLVNDDNNIPSLDEDSDSEGEDNDLIVSHADGTGKLLYHNTGRLRCQHSVDTHDDEYAHHMAQRDCFIIRLRPTARLRAQLTRDKQSCMPSTKRPQPRPGRPSNKGPTQADHPMAEAHPLLLPVRRILSLDELHQQLGHASEDRLRKAAANLADIQLDARTTLGPCIPCIQGKQHCKATG
jgi:hypothetical protein